MYRLNQTRPWILLSPMMMDLPPSQDTAKHKRLISDLIGKEQWMTLDADVKGGAYEGLHSDLRPSCENLRLILRFLFLCSPPCSRFSGSFPFDFSVLTP